MLVLPTGYETQDTFLNNHFYEMLKVFETELEKPQSLLIVIGFSFNDKHIAKMMRRALKNPELLVYVFCYDDKTKLQIMSNLKLTDEVNNIIFIQPNDLIGIYKTKYLSMNDVSNILKENLYEW